MDLQLPVLQGLPSVWSSKLRLAGLAVMLLITAMRTELQVRMAHMLSCRPGAVQTSLHL